MPKHAPLPIVDHATQKALLSRLVREFGQGRQPLRILEAGCGRRWPLDLGDTRFALTGVDIDRTSLEARRLIEGDLDETILGDLRAIELPSAGFDVIYSSYVLEHIKGAERVLDNFARWLRRDGLILIMIPDRDTVWGFVTRVTPYWLHVAFKRYIQRVRNAGEPGFGPFPTYHDKIVSRRGIHYWCVRNGFEVVLERGRQFRPRRLGVLIRTATKILAMVSLGRLYAHYNDVILVLRPIERERTFIAPIAS